MAQIRPFNFIRFIVQVRISCLSMHSLFVRVTAAAFQGRPGLLLTGLALESGDVTL